MRGKVGWSAERSGPEGITPAYAGKSGAGFPPLLCTGDHPRVCGEKPVAIQIRTIKAGSPPRMRGKVVSSRTILFLGGITPAYAGKRGRQACSIAGSEDHPRVCGEKCRPDWCARRCWRITPAYAGKRRNWEEKMSSTRDHPRVCGEKSTIASWTVCRVGSPPRMRGKAAGAPVGRLAVGITPAYAGKRGFSTVGSQYRGDHPRVCGEKFMMKMSLTKRQGSPPRMRGKAAAV